MMNKSKIKYITKYPCGQSFFSFHVYANNYLEAKEIAEKRKIGEIICGETNEKTNKELSNKDILHEICFLSYICLKSGIVDVEKILGDYGLLHEIIHDLSPKIKINIDAQVIERVNWLRTITPGYVPL